MKTVVVYASKYGSTKGVAEFIAEKLRQQGTRAEAQQVDVVHNPADYDAFVIGSGVYMVHWLKEATEFVMQNRTVLASRPVWLFSSGPLGSDASTNDPKLEPKEIAKFRDAINPRDHRVFFGALDSSKLGFAHRMTRKLPAARAMLPEGDFRDWKDIEAWASSIAQVLEASHPASESEMGA
jgi:menaquinone-dependent protoporphyrinogen oxidase